MPRFTAKVALLTMFTAVFVGLEARAFDNKTSKMKETETVDFQMVKFSGDDGYPLFTTSDPKGPIGNAQMSLRCTDNAYDVGPNGKNVVWKYHEIMIFDESGKAIARKEPRASVKSERGFNFRFKDFAECEKALVGGGDGSICTLRVQLKKSKGTAKVISSKCSPS